MGKYPVLLVAILILGHGVIARPQVRQSKQLSTTLASIVRNILDGTRDVVTAIYSAQAEAVTNFLTQTQSELTAASGFTSDIMDGTQHAADAITYISDDFFSSETSNRDGRKKKHPLPKLPPVPISFNKFFMNGIKSASGFADDKLKMLIQMSSNTGKLVSDTAKQISKVMEATEKFTKKVEKQRDKFENAVINEKLKLVETTKKSLSKFLKDLSKISRDASKSHDEGKARALLEAENELIDVTRESFRDILHETARAISRVSNDHSHRIPKKGGKKKKSKKSKKKKNTNVSSHHQTSEKQDMISRMLSSASEKIKVFAKLTKDISKAIRKATKQKEKDVKKAQKKIRKQIKKAQKAKKRIKKKTRKDINKIIKKKKHDPAHDDILSTPEGYNATIDGVPVFNENGTEINSTATSPPSAKPQEENETSEEEEDDDYYNEDDEDEDDEENDEDDEDDIDDENNDLSDDEDYEEDEEQADEEDQQNDDDEDDVEEDVTGDNDEGEEEDARAAVKDDDKKEIVENKTKPE